MVNIEKKRIEVCGTGNESIGHITLDKLAYPKSVKVVLLGKKVIPMSFDCYGHPNFTHEQLLIYKFKERQLKRQSNDESVILEAEIAYKERPFVVPKNKFDTIEGIEDSLWSLYELNRMLENRKIFCKIYPDAILNEFIIYDRYLLDQTGEVLSVKQTTTNDSKLEDEVKEYENNSEAFSLSENVFEIPTVGSVCPCCGKALTLEDVKNNPCKNVGGKFYHNSCWLDFRKIMEIEMEEMF